MEVISRKLGVWIRSSGEHLQDGTRHLEVVRVLIYVQYHECAWAVQRTEGIEGMGTLQYLTLSYNYSSKFYLKEEWLNMC